MMTWREGIGRGVCVGGGKERGKEEENKGEGEEEEVRGGVNRGGRSQ